MAFGDLRTFVLLPLLLILIVYFHWDQFLLPPPGVDPPGTFGIIALAIGFAVKALL